MKKTILIAALILNGFTTFAQTADAISDKYLTAIGGADKYNTVQSYTLKNSYKANATTDYDEEINAIKAETKFTRKKTLLNRDFYYILNGNSGWLKIPMGSRDKAPTYVTKDLAANERADLVNDLNDGLAIFVDYANKGYKYNGIVTAAVVNGVNCNSFVLEKNKIKKTFYFDVNTGLLKRMMVDNGTMISTTDYLNYKESNNGLKYASTANYIDNKDKKNTAITSDLVVNPSIAAAVFQK